LYVSFCWTWVSKLLVNFVWPGTAARLALGTPSPWESKERRAGFSLPPYAILERYIERDQTPEEIVRAGFDPATVMRVVKLVDRNEYKRRQAAPGVRISRRAFGRDRRYPITSGYSETSPVNS
jgi:NAD+ synthase (glutamine-hydrolysing)